LSQITNSGEVRWERRAAGQVAKNLPSRESARTRGAGRLGCAGSARHLAVGTVPDATVASATASYPASVSAPDDVTSPADCSRCALGLFR
jgi:hypothetical protein